MQSLKDLYHQLMTSHLAPRKQGWGTPTPPANITSLTSEVVNLVLSQAIIHRTSDIHFEPSADHIRIRFRIDGKLYEALTIPHAAGLTIIPRIKILCSMSTDSISGRKAMDGRFSATINHRDYDFRVATFPTLLGEKVAIRILSKDFGMIDLAKLGMNASDLARIEQISQRKNGLLIVSGPTGSGKTTTLYSILNRLNSPHVNIITLEDPVEYQIAGINQCDIKHKGDESFASALKAVLRQDPNILLIGEIRDNETADIVIRASLTGHLVMTSLHANNAIGTVVRLINMGLERYMVSYALAGAVAQRLIPRLCEKCRAPYTAGPELLDRLNTQCGIPPEAFFRPKATTTPGTVEYFSADTDTNTAAANELIFYRNTGCDACSGTGYFGRMGIFEVVVFNDELRAAIIRNASTPELQAIAAQKGFRTLADDAIDKLKAGYVTLEDIYPILLEAAT